MAVFADNFNRANGALGGNWNTYAGACNIVSNAVQGTGSSSAFNTTVSDDTYQEASANLTWLNTAFAGPGVMVCVAADGSGGFSTKFRTVSGNPTLSVTSGGYGGTTYIIDYTLPTPLPPYFHVKLVWSDGNLELFYNGASVGTASSGLYIGAPYMGIGVYAAYGAVLDFQCVGTNAISLTADPDVVGNYGDCTDITLTGVNTSWTAGTPGSPTFTVNHGTISAQTVASATSATITYCPGDYLGSVTITDPSTGATVGIVVTSDPNTVPPSGMWLSQEAVDYIERSAIAQTNPTILNQETVIDPDGLFGTAQDTLGWFYRNLAKLIDPDGEPPTGDHYMDFLAKMIAGGWGYTEGEDVTSLLYATRNTALHVEEFFLTTTPDVWWTIEQLIATLKGTGTRDLTDVYDEISTVAAATGAGILNVIAELRGDEVATVAGIVADLSAIRTASNWTLGDAKTWAEAVRGSGLPTVRSVLDKLDLVQPSTSYTLTTIASQVTTVDTVVDGIATSVGALRTGSNLTLQDVLDAVDALATQVGALQTGAPVWPGLAGVTLGGSVALSNGLVVDGPMHGLLIAITGTPATAGKYEFGTVDSWQHVGGVIFQTDGGDYERAESFGLDSQIVVPRNMLSADSAVIRLKTGFTGTVRPWTRNA